MGNVQLHYKDPHHWKGCWVQRQLDSNQNTPQKTSTAKSPTTTPAVSHLLTYKWVPLGFHPHCPSHLSSFRFNSLRPPAIEGFNNLITVTMTAFMRMLNQYGLTFSFLIFCHTCKLTHLLLLYPESTLSPQMLWKSTLHDNTNKLA